MAKTSAPLWQNLGGGGEGCILPKMLYNKEEIWTEDVFRMRKMEELCL